MSVIVDDLDVMGVAVAPDEADSEPVVDPDAVLTPSVAAQRFQPVSGEDRQIPKLVGRVQLAELPLSDAGDHLRAAGRPPVEEPLGFLRPERPDHELKGYNVTRNTSSGIAASRGPGRVCGWEAGIRTPITWFTSPRAMKHRPIALPSLAKGRHGQSVRAVRLILVSGLRGVARSARPIRAHYFTEHK